MEELEVLLRSIRKRFPALWIEGPAVAEMTATAVSSGLALRETLARFGIVARPGNVRLPPLPPLWR